MRCRSSPLFAALGLHPLYIAQHHEPQLEQLAMLLAERPHKLVAVGEIGLDLYMDNPQFERQQSVLLAQLRLAKQHDLPVILHSRRTHDQLAAALRRMQLPRRGVVHGFAGSLSQAQAFIRLGYYIGVGGTITYERAQKTRGVMAQLPLEALLLETDAPDMPLAGYQGQPNRPERAAGRNAKQMWIGQRIAQIPLHRRPARPQPGADRQRHQRCAGRGSVAGDDVDAVARSA